MSNVKNFIVKDNNGHVVFEGIGGDANAWAEKNVCKYGDLFVHYYGENVTIAHWFMGEVKSLFWGNVTIAPICVFEGTANAA